MDNQHHDGYALSNTVRDRDGIYSDGTQGKQGTQRTRGGSCCSEGRSVKGGTAGGRGRRGDEGGGGGGVAVGAAQCRKRKLSQRLGLEGEEERRAGEEG